MLCLTWGVISSYAQTHVIKGKVTDEKDLPLPGVTVTLKQSQQRVVSNAEGNYSLDLGSTGGTILVFSFVGFQTQEINISGKTTANVKLIPESKDLSEVVISALNIPRAKKSLGVSQQSVNVDEMTQARAANITDLLDGKVSGLQITTSGQATGSTRVVIRGPGSISGNNQPLWVVDGVPIDNTDSNGQVGNIDYGNNAADLNPDDIQSIEVLKGPNAAALYGSRAANGAILVTTKKGKKNAGLGVSVNSNYMIGRILQFPDFQNVYGEGSNNVLSGTRNAQGVVQEGTNTRNWGAPMLGQPYANFQGQLITYSPQPDNVKGLYQNSYAATNNIAFSSANDNSAIRFSYTRTDANDVIAKQALQTKNNFAINASKDFTSYLKVETRIQYLQEVVQNRTARNEDPANPNNYYNNALRSVSLNDLIPWKDANGNAFTNSGASGIENPYWNINENYNRDNKNTIIGGVTATLSIFKDLKFRGQVASNMIWGNRFNFIDKGSLSNKPGSYGDFQQNNQNWNTEGLFMYNKRISDFTIVANVGGNLRKSNYYSTSANITALAVHDVMNINNNAGITTNREDQVRSQTNSLYGTASIGYKGYLYLDLTGRNDWSSTLPPANRSFFYPSVSSSFVFSEFFKIPASVMSFGKLRASVAVVGNDTSPYNLNSSFNYGGNLNSSYPYVSFDQVLKNSNLKPEKVTSTEIGLELKFLNDRISFDGSVYKKNTVNQILQGSIPSASGYTTQFINAGEVSNKGIELSVGANPVRTKNFSWDFVINFSANKNKVIALSPGLDQYKIGGVLLTGVYAEVGQPIGVLRGEDLAKDANGNKLIIQASGLPYSQSTPFTTDGKTQAYLGNYQPKSLMSFGSNFKYKDFDLNFLVTARIGGQLFSGTYWRADQNGVTNESLYGRDAYELANLILGESGNALLGKTSLYNLPYPDASRPKGAIFPGYYPLTDGKGNIVYDAKGNMIADLNAPNTQWLNPNTYWTRAYHINSMLTFDASYVKLTQVIVGYNISQKLLRRTFFKSAHVSLVGRNLWFIFQKTPKGIDPESAYSSGNAQGLELGGALPYANYGIDLKFSL
jgi:TonB-linked SusC/RagA family outer membrane protein